jgi:predicted RNA binding protein YcfA (HicA-like mRNA interferase family)
MSRLRTLSGKDIVKIFSRFGFRIISQKGSHVKLRRVLAEGTRQTLTIPLHSEIDKGTLKAIFRQSLRYIPEDKLRPLFYRER